jgi:ubiquitin C-terminal hydrolase
LPLILSNNKTRLRKDQNLCFVNATLQVLYSIEDVREIFTADE